MLTFGPAEEPIGLVDRKWTTYADGTKARHFYGMLDRSTYEHIISSSKDIYTAAERIENILVRGESESDPTSAMVDRLVRQKLNEILGSAASQIVVQPKAAPVPAAEAPVEDIRAKVIAELEKKPGVARTKDGRIHESVIKAAMNRYEVTTEPKPPKVKLPLTTPKKKPKDNWADAARQLGKAPAPMPETWTADTHDAEVDAIVKQANG